MLQRFVTEKISLKLIHAISSSERTHLTTNVKWEFYLFSNQHMIGRGNFWQMNKQILGSMFQLEASKYHLVILTKNKQTYKQQQLPPQKKNPKNKQKSNIIVIVQVRILIIYRIFWPIRILEDSVAGEKVSELILCCYSVSRYKTIIFIPSEIGLYYVVMNLSQTIK